LGGKDLRHDTDKNQMGGGRISRKLIRETRYQVIE
jgi:hypothetical protein